MNIKHLLKIKLLNHSFDISGCCHEECLEQATCYPRCITYMCIVRKFENVDPLTQDNIQFSRSPDVIISIVVLATVSPSVVLIHHVDHERVVSLLVRFHPVPGGITFQDFPTEIEFDGPRWSIRSELPSHGIVQIRATVESQFLTDGSHFIFRLIY